MNNKTYCVNIPSTGWTWEAFSIYRHAVPYADLLWPFLLERTKVESCTVVLSLEEGKLSADIPDLLIPALLVLLGVNQHRNVAPELVGVMFEHESVLYRLGYINDPEEHDYGWYIVAL